MKRVAVLWLAFFVVGCAEAGRTDKKGADEVDAGTDIIDAAIGGFPDAPPVQPPVDAAPLPPDAPPQSGTPDALPPGSNLFCNDSTECASATECCLLFGDPPGFCVIGTEPLPGLCIPQF